MKVLSPYALWATLYMPATRPDLLDVVFRRDQLMAHLSEANLLAIRLQEQPEATEA